MRAKNALISGEASVLSSATSRRGMILSRLLEAVTIAGPLTAAEVIGTGVLALGLAVSCAPAWLVEPLTNSARVQNDVGPVLALAGVAIVWWSRRG
jgi:hypothetical protein